MHSPSVALLHHTGRKKAPDRPVYWIWRIQWFKMSIKARKCRAYAGFHSVLVILSLFRDSAEFCTDVLQSFIILTGVCPGMVSEYENIGS